MGQAALSLMNFLAITGTWTLPFAAYLTLLANRIVYQRLKTEKSEALYQARVLQLEY